AACQIERTQSLIWVSRAVLAICKFQSDADQLRCWGTHVTAVMRDDLQIRPVVRCSVRRLTFAIELSSEIELRIGERRVGGHGFLPALERFVGMTQLHGQDTVVRE